LWDFYLETARLLQTNARNIAFAYNATDAFARALSAIPFNSGDSILTTNDDYISNQINFLSLQKRFGLCVLRVPNLSSGDLDLEQMEALLKVHHPKLVAVTHIPTNSGLVQDVEAVGRLCRQFSTFYLVDGCQSLGQMELDVEKIGCDFLSATGRKFLRGPRGTGFLFVSDRILEEGLEPLFIDMRGATWKSANEYVHEKDARRFELWENPYSAMVGLKEAIRYANELGMGQIVEYNRTLIDALRKGLGSLPGIELLDRGSAKSNIVTFHKEGMPLSVLQEALTAQNVVFSVSKLENARIDFENKGVEGAVRVSPHYFNTIEEAENLMGIIASI
jgi:selenocysteine lyase/cysteine desulfurase